MQQSAPTDVVQTLDEDFGQRIATVRKAAGLSQRALAEILKDLGLQIDPSAITRLERGERTVKVSEAQLLAVALDTTLGDLLDEDEPIPSRALRRLRADANDYMTSARSALGDFLTTVAEIKELLVENPQLLGILGDDLNEPPATVNEYIPWVTRRVKIMTDHGDWHVATSSDRSDLGDLQALALAVATDAVGIDKAVTFRAPRPSSESLEEGSTDHMVEIRRALGSIVASLGDMDDLGAQRLRSSAVTLQAWLGDGSQLNDAELHALGLEVRRIIADIRSGTPMHKVTGAIRTLLRGISSVHRPGWIAAEGRVLYRGLDLDPGATDAEAHQIELLIQELVGRMEGAEQIDSLDPLRGRKVLQELQEMTAAKLPAAEVRTALENAVAEFS